MPRLPFEPPALTDIGERAALASIRRARGNIDALQEYARSGLSPLEMELQRQRIAYYETVASRSEDLIKEIRRRRSEYQAEALRPKRAPLHRSSRDRNAAILGTLERERKRNVALSRAATERAQSRDASRRLFSENVGQFDFGVRSLRRNFQKSGLGSLFGAGAMMQQLLDPCAEVEHKENVRREVMFAQKFAGRGYRGPHHRRIC